jgi:hypothetical protein
MMIAETAPGTSFSRSAGGTGFLAPELVGARN